MAENTADDVYTIDPDGSGPNVPFGVYCDMTRDGGGWTLAAEVAGGWQDVARGTTIGYTRLARIDTIRAQRFRLSLSSALGPLRLATFGLHLDTP